MENTVYYLASCSTCKKIIKSLPNSANLKYHDIRENPLTESEVDYMKSLAGSYNALFSRKAQLYKERGLKNQELSESDIKSLLLEHYTFLSRPVFILNDTIYVGNSQQNIHKVMQALNNE